MEVTRGDMVLCVVAGDFGKRRPALVVQSDLFNPSHASIALLPITSHQIDTPLFRIPIRAGKTNGLETNSQIMVDKITAVRLDRIKERIGRASPKIFQETEVALLRFLGFE